MISALSRRDDFLLLSEIGTTRRSGPLRARVIVAEPPITSMKVGFTVGRSFGTAVKRNRIRRRLRHCIVEAAQSTQVATTHLLVGAAPTALCVSHPELVNHCRRLMEPAS
ncbi:MAG: ribonuclease P protein component [Acidimicrobiia bacterium]|nr:ribonuclease P protein component [Acidimicrobiia bacterium]